MEVYLTLVDWPVAEAKLAQGVFESEFFDAVDEAAWVTEADFSDTFGVVTGLGECLQSLLPDCSSANREAILHSLALVIKSEPQQLNDLPVKLDAETFWLALCPQTVGEFAAHAKRIDFDELQRLYDNDCPAGVRDELGYNSVEFAEHLQGWCGVIEQACKLHRGLVATAG